MAAQCLELRRRQDGTLQATVLPDETTISGTKLDEWRRDGYVDVTNAVAEKLDKWAQAYALGVMRANMTAAGVPAATSALEGSVVTLKFENSEPTKYRITGVDHDNFDLTKEA